MRRPLGSTGPSPRPGEPAEEARAPHRRSRERDRPGARSWPLRPGLRRPSPGVPVHETGSSSERQGDARPEREGAPNGLRAGPHRWTGSRTADFDPDPAAQVGAALHGYRSTTIPREERSEVLREHPSRARIEGLRPSEELVDPQLVPRVPVTSWAGRGTRGERRGGRRISGSAGGLGARRGLGDRAQEEMARLWRALQGDAARGTEGDPAARRAARNARSWLLLRPLLPQHHGLGMGLDVVDQAPERARRASSPRWSAPPRRERRRPHRGLPRLPSSPRPDPGPCWPS